jgi:hypothetical protein
MSGELPPWRGNVDGEDGDWEDSELSLENSALNVERRLTRQQKLQRGGLGLLVVLVAAFFLLGGPSIGISWLGTLRTSVSQSAPSLSTPEKLSNVSSSEFTLPQGVQNTLTLKLAPANGPDSYVYACWIDQQENSEMITHSFHVGIHTHGTSGWMEPPAPVSTASTCAIVADRERETGVVLAVWPVDFLSPANFCVLPQLFHSDDGGQFWTAIPWPSLIQPTCDPEFYLEAGRLYVQSTISLLPRSMLARSSAAGFLLTTDTSTVVWRPADNGQASDGGFQLIGLRPNGRLLAESLQGNVASNQAGLLWESVDSGQHWQISAPLPGDAPVVSVSSDPEATDHGGWGYVYVNYLTSGIGSEPALIYGTLNTPGGSWISLPQPEGVDMLEGGPMVAYLADGGEGPFESFIDLCTQDSGAHLLTTKYVPWLWDTAQKVWRLDPIPLPANSVPQGVSWWGGRMTLIVSVIHQGVQPFFQTFSLTLTPHQLAAAH